MTVYLGIALVALPYVVVFGFSFWAIGWRWTAGLIACIVAVVAVLAIGITLITGGAR